MFKNVEITNFNVNPYSMIGKQWMLIAAGTDKVNAMTASWGGMGIMWNKNVTFTVVRPQRHTKIFIDANDTFSLTFFDEKYRKELNYFGTVSGKDEDKVAKSGFTVEHKTGAPYFKEADTVIICKKLFSQLITKDSFIDKTLPDKWYENNDYHYLYVSEVLEILKK